MLSIKLLGGLLLEDESKALRIPIPHRHQRALLALLATSLSRPTSREKLYASLWPERDTTHARSLLNQAVHGLRKALGEVAIISSREELRLDAEVVHSDVDEFERALESEEWNRAISLYAGPFLDGFFLSNAAEFERWVDGERARIRRAYLEALEKLAARAAVRGDAREAVRWWRRLVDEDPYSARRAIGLMEALESAGDRAAAIRHGREHTRLLAEEMEAEPNPEVVDLAERMRREPLTGGSSPNAELFLAAVATGESPPEAPDAAGTQVGGDAQRRASLWWVVGSVTGLLLLTVGIWPGLAPSPPLDPRRVVVAPFENLTGDTTLDVLGRITADWIIQGLSRTNLVEVVPTSATLASARAVQGTARDADGGTISGMAEETDAGLVVSGSFYAEADSLHFQAAITNVREDRVLQALAPVSSPRASPLGAVELLRQRVTGALAPVIDERLSVPASVTQQPPSYNAYREYADGMDAFIDRRWREAIPMFRRASALDTTYLVPRLDIAFAYINLGERYVADTLAQRLDRSRDRLGPYDRATLDVALALIDQDRPRAYRAARHAAEIAPGTLTNVQWGREALGLGRPREAIEILSHIDPTRGEVRGWSLYWDHLTEAHHMLGQHGQELHVAHRARGLHPDDSHYYLYEARALAALGRVDDVESVVDVGLSRSFPDSALDQGSFMVQVAEELHAHGHGDAARRMFGRAARWYAGLPEDDPESYGTWRAEALLYLGKAEAADSVLDKFRARRPEDLWATGYAGIAAAMRGDRAGAEKALAFLRSIDDPYVQRGQRLMLQAAITAWLGRKSEAIPLLRRAFSEGLRYGILPHSGGMLDPLRDDPSFQALMRPRGD